jgi:hypothetical protein
MVLFNKFREAATMARDLGSTDLYQRILDLQASVSELQANVLDLTRAAFEKDQKIASLGAALEARARIQKQYPFYFVEGDPNPICRYCYDTEEAVIYLDPPFNIGDGFEYHCPKCQKGDRSEALLPETKMPAPRQEEPLIDVVPKHRRDWSGY